MAEIVIRRVEQGDLSALLDLYNHYVRESPVTFDLEPRTLAQRQEWLDHFAPTGRYQCFVAVEDDAVLGWASSHKFRERAAYDTSIETSVYVAPARHGQGLGRRLYGDLFQALAQQDIHRAYAGITQPNEASNRLHAAMGFGEAGRLTQIGRKFERYWDVAIWLRPMGQMPASRA